jgi:hypothetical protein
MADIYAQRISASGAGQWALGGVAVGVAAGNQKAAAIAADGAGGAAIAWQDQRDDATGDIYVQQVSAAGVVRWAAGGLAVCTAAGEQGKPSIVGDHHGGAIVAWRDVRNGTGDVYAQRVDDAGALQWADGGVAMCLAAGDQNSVMIAGDLAGGAIASWQDTRSGVEEDVYAQRITPDGQLGGVAVSAPEQLSSNLVLSPVWPNPASGGAVVVQFALPSGLAATLELYDLAGHRLATREVGSLGAGRHAVTFDPGCRMASGRYLVSLQQGDERRVARLTVLR